jgi:hypothetical protein
MTGVGWHRCDAFSVGYILAIKCVATSPDHADEVPFRCTQEQYSTAKACRIVETTCRPRQPRTIPQPFVGKLLRANLVMV